MSVESDEKVSTLYNMMKLLDGMRYDYAYALHYVQDAKIANRNYAVNWMKYVSSQCSIIYALFHR